MNILAVTGLRREARIAAGAGVVTVSGGGNRESLERQIGEALQQPIRGIVSFGVAGALAPPLKPGDCIIATRVADGAETFASNDAWQRFVSQKMPQAHCGAMIGSQEIVASALQKSELFRSSRALAVDMESHVAARAARERGLPFIAIRTISDSAERALPPAALSAVKPDGGLNGFAIARSLLARPTQIPDLIRTGRESEKAFAELLRCLDLLGGLFALPDLG